MLDISIQIIKRGSNFDMCIRIVFFAETFDSKYMKLLADSGSTKTAWVFLDEKGNTQHITNEGINPTQQDEVAIRATVLPVVYGNTVKEVYFYGSGVIEENKYKIRTVFQELLPDLQYIEVHNDIYAAARALCKNEAGIVGILGTGANSCVYDGNEVIANIGGFGFILGDEGSGAVLGTKLLSDFLYKKIPTKLYEALKAEYQLTTDYIFQKVYFTPLPNRFLARFAPFIHKHRHEPYMRELLQAHFAEFFEYKVVCYDNYKDYPCHLVGSIAYYFEDIIREQAATLGIQVGNIAQTPMEGLLKYHQS